MSRPGALTPRVLVADDQPDVLEALRILLKAEGFEATTASSPAEVMKDVEQGDFDLALIDLNYTRDTTSGKEGLDLLSSLRDLDETLQEVLVNTRSGRREAPREDEETLEMLRTLGYLN